MRAQRTAGSGRGWAARLAVAAVGILGMLGGVSAGALAAQEQPSAMPGIFSEVLDVRVINIEVQVTDKDGTPIRGLGPGDFELLVDGEAVSIDYFSEIRNGIVRPAARPAAEPGALESAAAPPAVPSLAPGEPVGVSYLVFVDDFFSLKPDRNRVLEALAANLGFLRPEDRMAVVAYDGKDLDMLTSWTDLEPVLERAFQDAMGRPAHGLRRRVERERANFTLFDGLARQVGREEELGFSEFHRNLRPDERAYIGELTGQLNRSIAAAAATLRSFAKPPGRKVLLLLSGGWPFVPADYLLGGLSTVLFERSGPYGRNLYNRLTETANLLGYTIYPVDVPGLDREFAGQASVARLPDDVNSRADFGFEVEGQAHATLTYLARQTGGRAILNQGRVQALERVAGDVDSYYWLGFSPAKAEDDSRHQVRVVLRDPSFRVRSRRSYLDSSRSSEVSMAVESTLLFGNAAAASTLAIEVGDPVTKSRRRIAVPLKILVPLDEVTFLPAADGYVARLELRLAVQDDHGDQAPIPVIPLDLQLSSEPEAGQIGTYETELELRRRSHAGVVAVHDPASGRILSAGFDIDP